MISLLSVYEACKVTQIHYVASYSCIPIQIWYPGYRKRPRRNGVMQGDMGKSHFYIASFDVAESLQVMDRLLATKDGINYSGMVSLGALKRMTARGWSVWMYTSNHKLCCRHSPWNRTRLDSALACYREKWFLFFCIMEMTNSSPGRGDELWNVDQ